MTGSVGCGKIRLVNNLINKYQSVIKTHLCNGSNTNNPRKLIISYTFALNICDATIHSGLTFDPLNNQKKAIIAISSLR